MLTANIMGFLFQFEIANDNLIFKVLQYLSAVMWIPGKAVLSSWQKHNALILTFAFFLSGLLCPLLTGQPKEAGRAIDVWQVSPLGGGEKCISKMGVLGVFYICVRY